MGGLAPGLGPVSGSPGPLRGHTSRLRSFWGGCWNEPVAVPAQGQEGWRCAFLMASTRGRLLVLGGGSVHGSDALNSRMGACLWDLSLGRTGDARLMGKHFRVGCWFFSWGGGGGEEELQGTTAEARFADDASSKRPYICSVLYIAQWRFRCSMIQAVAKGALNPRCPGTDTCTVRTSTARRPGPHRRQ